MFSETRYARNGDLRVAYRTTEPGDRDIVFVSNWFTNCEILPELPSMQGWVERMSTLGRVIFFDQPGTGASDPVPLDALPTLELWMDSITAVLDDLAIDEAVLVTIDGAFSTGALLRPHTPPALLPSWSLKVRPSRPRSFQEGNSFHTWPTWIRRSPLIRNCGGQASFSRS